MKIKTSELQGLALDWAVAAALGWRRAGAADAARDALHEGVFETVGWADNGRDRWEKLLAGGKEWSPSTDWSQGGPLIEKGGISVKGWHIRWEATLYWSTRAPGDECKSYHTRKGSGPLIAICRCFVASKLGEEVDVPEELL